MGIRFEGQHGLIIRWPDGQYTSPDEVRIFTDTLPRKQFGEYVDDTLKDFPLKQMSSGRYFVTAILSSTDSKFSLRDATDLSREVPLELNTTAEGLLNDIPGKFSWESNPQQQLRAFTRRIPTLP